ncbi:MAG: sodium-dependent transporter [Candidatus Latescibacteria bacterium]|nr:sodium-dependent transporter [Candidatus Latescibacterota bacterium]NIM66418.1 sodium-dependent transporter [Candidatus Latescibacterota bacterium]NIO02897.1 sodium-dependent transporter [Candidatus Latescibacterota bacterium]NIO30032.1 sodium-dependent transporter [Candidatus Latescibacterota bacterium]NIO57647.1 sodium-dependent transporter [Candidatus Latescibacterota bacterium]
MYLAPDGVSRGQWKTRLGFILAASGSAIGLGNIVFFSANAYRFGGGAFYLPYLIALFAMGIPVMILEFGLGNFTGRAFPESLYRIAGKKGEFVGWWAIFNAFFITMYYITILGWVFGMLTGAFGDLWKESLPVPAFGLEEGVLDNPYAYFFRMLSTWQPVLFVLLVWIFNVIIVRRGPETIEQATRIFVPLMWIFMIVLIIRGVTLTNGFEGVMLLFTPDFSVMKDSAVWQGAFSQIFFTLSLGFGIMTAYASYLPKKSDLTQNAFITSFLNCGFEYIAGLAVFSILFAFAMVPRASTLAMMFFILPKGISQLPGGLQAVIPFGTMFFILLLLAGLTSSVSLVEALVSSMRDKFGWSRWKTITVAGCFGFIGSAVFALPQIVNPGLQDNGTLGFTILDFVDHWAFSYGLLIIGLFECILVGWIMGADTIRAHLNSHSRMRLGIWFDALIKYIIPLALLFVLGYSIKNEITDGLYGTAFSENYNEPYRFMRYFPGIVLAFWLLSSTLLSLRLTRKGKYESS